MSHASETIRTRGRGFIELTASLQRAVAASGVEHGLVNAFCHHTSCSLLITENADPTVRADLERYFARLVPDGDALFRHDAEGPDDMPAHVRAVLTGLSVSVPIVAGRAALGTWQGLYLYEHRTAPHERKVTYTVVRAA